MIRIDYEKNMKKTSCLIVLACTVIFGQRSVDLICVISDIDSHGNKATLQSVYLSWARNLSNFI